MQKYNPRIAGVLPGSGGCGAPPVRIAQSELPQECSAISRQNMRTYLPIGAKNVQPGATVAIDLSVNATFRVENLKVDSTNAASFEIVNITLGNDQTTPAQNYPLSAQIMAEVSTDVCLRWPDLSPSLPGQMLVRNKGLAAADFDAAFLGWMNPA